MQNIFGAFKEMCSSCSLRFPLCCRFHTLWTYWFDYVWFTSTLRITKGKFDCAADLQFDPKSPIIHPSKSKKCKRKMVSLLFWFPICSIPTEELKALLHVLRTSWLHHFMCVSGNGGLSESPHQRCHPRLCRRSPPYLLSFVHSRARFWRSCSRGKQRELILLPPEHLQLNSKLHDMFHMLPCHLVLIRHDLYLNMLKATATVNSWVSHIDNTATGLRLGPAVLTSSCGPLKLGS